MPQSYAADINQAFERGDREEFHRLLQLHPEFLRHEDGADIWMWRAAMDGKLDLIQALVDLGMDVNESREFSTPDDPFYSPEGAILHAASEGHLEVVGWLLEQGAQINYVVQGQPRCLPLIDAATNGHLDVVKLLVEHGGDFQATWNGVNAMTQAEDYGHWAIRDYLRSLGARTLRETTPPDYPRTHKKILKDVTELKGPISDWRLELPGEPAVTLYQIPVNKHSDVQIVFTVGLSDHPLPRGKYEDACTELRILLPKEWPLTEAALQNEKWSWPLEWLKRLIDQLRHSENWPAEPVLIMNGEPPQPLTTQTELCGWLCLRAMEETIPAPDYRWIDMHSMFPIYAEEAELVRKQGYEELVNRLYQSQVPLFIDLQRPNMAKNRM